MAESFFQSSEFRRSSRNASDTGIKLFFRFFTSVSMGVIHFMQQMFKMMMGK